MAKVREVTLKWRDKRMDKLGTGCIKKGTIYVEKLLKNCNFIRKAVYVRRENQKLWL